MEKRKIPGVLILVGALGFISAAIYLSYDSYLYMRDNDSITGIVIDSETVVSRTPGSTGSIETEYPIVEYTVNDESYKVQPKWTLGISLEKGDSVSVFYVPSQPSQAKIETLGEFFGLPTVFIIIAFFMYITGYSIVKE